MKSKTKSRIEIPFPATINGREYDSSPDLPPVVVINKQSLGPGMLKREERKWKEAEKRVRQLRAKSPNPSDKYRQQLFIYPEAKVDGTALWFVTKEMQYSWFKLETAKDMLTAIIQGLQEGPMQKYGAKEDGEYLYVEGVQFAAMIDILDWARLLLAHEWEAGKKRAVEGMLLEMMRFGHYSEQKHAGRAEAMTQTRQSPDPVLDKKASKILSQMGEQTRNITKAARDAGEELGRTPGAIRACAVRLRQRISREGRKRSNRKK